MRPVLCLDFGSAFTKVALRREPEEPSVLVEAQTLNFDEMRICVPTLVATLQRGGTTRWTCGIDAAGLKDGGGIKVYRNWKKHLFSSDASTPPANDSGVEAETDFLDDLDAVARERKRIIRQIARAKGLAVEDVVTIATKKRLTLDKLRSTYRLLRPERDDDAEDTIGVTPPAIREVAVTFFKWLQQFIEEPCKKHGITDILKVPVRLCTPAFNPDDNAGKGTAGEELLLAIVEEAGWKPDATRPVISEPFANAIGTLTEGANKTWIPKKSGGQRFINMPEMFSHQGLLTAYRNRSLGGPRGPSEHVILVVDVGAYTSDFALLEFDLGDVEAPPWINSISEPVAVEVLERDVLAELPDPKRQAMEGLSMEVREDARRRLYRDSVPYASEAGEVGEGAEMGRIQGCIESFGDRVAGMAERFLGEKGFDHIDELVLTGGGNNIPIVRSAIQKRLKKRGVKLTHVPQLKNSEENTKTLHRLDQRLVRGGSALGGASVFFDNLVS